MHAQHLLQSAFRLALAAASAALAHALVASVASDAVLELGSYVLVGAALVFLLKPHPCASSRPLLNEARLSASDSAAIDYQAIVCERTPATGKRYLVVGAGFVGKKLIHSLLLRGETHVRVFDADRTACDVFKNDPRLEFIHGDVTKLEQVVAAMDGIEHVFSTFAVIRFMDRLPHQADLSYNINVVGTENVVRAAQQAGVQVLVQTSTSNVNVDPAKCSLDMDEKVPYVTRDRAANHYSWTKAIAEQIVLNAHSRDGMYTAAVRPCSAVFGAEDRHLLDPMLKLGRTILPPNGGVGVIDFIAVNNVVWGHLLCERELMENPDCVGGQAFCVSNGGPMRMRDFIGIIDRVRPGGLVTVPTPQMLLVYLAYAIEAAKMARLPVPRALDQLTGCTVSYLDLNYSFNSKKALDLLGYRPLYTVEQGVDLAVKEWVAGKMLPAL